MRKKAGLESQIRLERNFLYDSYGSEIDETIEFFNERLDFLRSPGRISQGSIGSEQNLVSWTKQVLRESNLHAVLKALEYCQDAIRELEKMKLRPERDLQKIEKLKAGVPGIDEYQKFTGEKPMER